MIKTAKQLKDLIRNLSKKNAADAQILMRNYMLILKGGMLVAAMVGLDVRSTMDMDATIKGVNVNVEDVKTPLKIDISTGDAITPKEVRYSFKLMLEDRSIDVWAYNLETVLAEKMETIITRATT